MTATTSMLDTEAALRRALDEGDIRMAPGPFLDLLRTALRAVRGPGIAADPAGQLTNAEAAELRRGGMGPTKDGTAYDRVRAATGARFASMLATSMSTADAAARLKLDASRIRQLLAERRLLGIRDGGEWRLLELQFGDRGLVPNIGQVIAALPEGLPPFVAASWFGTPESDLEIDDEAVSPIEWLSAGGDPDRVAQLAHDL